MFGLQTSFLRTEDQAMLTANDINTAVWADKMLSLRKRDAYDYHGIETICALVPAYQLTTKVIVANLWWGHRNGVMTKIRRSKKSFVMGKGAQHRYKIAHWTYGKVRRVLDTMIFGGWLEQHIGYRDAVTGEDHATLMRAAPKLAAMFEGLEPEFQMLAEPELVQLHHNGTMLAYIDTKETRRVRVVLHRYNTCIENITLSFKTPSCEVCAASLYLCPKNQKVSERLLPLKKALRSVHSDDLQSGGRLYGVAYQRLSNERRKDILINGEPTVELDYSAQHPSICYTLCGHSVPEDIYEVVGFPRSVTKSMLLMLLNAANEKDAINAWKDQRPSNKHPVPKEYLKRGKELVGKLVEKHKAIDSWFCSNAWRRLQYIDSRIALGVLERMLDASVPVLPIHDSFIAPARHYSVLKEAMDAASQDQIGIRLKIK
jgi:hypothetical protein